MNKNELSKYYKTVESEFNKKNSELDGLLTIAKQKIQEIEKNKSQSTESFNALNKTYNQLLEIINKSNTDIAKITELRAVAMNPESGVESLLAKLSTTSEQATQNSNSIEELKSISVKNSESSQLNNTASKKALSSINEIEKKSTKLIKDLEKTYKLATNTAVAGAFNVRKKSIETNYVKKWHIRLIVYTGLLIFATIAILISSLVIDGATMEWMVYIRFAFLSPIVFYVTYAAFQYNFERKLLEKYAFKEVVAASLESYANVIDNIFDKDTQKDKVIKFYIDSMTTTFREPHEETTRRSWGLSFGSRWAKIKSELAEELAPIIEKKIEDDKISEK